MGKLKYWSGYFLIVLGLAGVVSCKNGNGDGPVTRYDSGTIHISADESFKPVVDELIKVYGSFYPKTNIIAHYKTEAECLEDFRNDSISLVIATRGFSESERRWMIDSGRVAPTSKVMAYDAVAVIVHPASADSSFTIGKLGEYISGADTTKQAVFDGLTATSTVRFMLDSVLKSDKLGPNVKAAEGSQAVIDYVSKVPGAIGFIGVSWIGNREDTLQLSFLQKVKIAWVEATDSGYVKPYQANIYDGTYPMVRDLVYVLKEKRRGLAHSFASFMMNESRGQLIFRRSYLLPAYRPYKVRRAKIKLESN